MNNDSVRFIIHQWRQNIVVQVLCVCTSKRSKNSCTIFSSLLKSFLRIVFTWLSPKTRTLRLFLVLLAQSLLFGTVTAEKLLRNFQVVHAGGLYFAQYQLHEQMCFCFQLEFCQVYLELYSLVFSLLNFDYFYVAEKVYCSVRRIRGKCHQSFCFFQKYYFLYLQNKHTYFWKQQFANEFYFCYHQIYIHLIFIGNRAFLGSIFKFGQVLSHHYGLYFHF